VVAQVLEHTVARRGGLSQGLARARAGKDKECLEANRRGLGDMFS
jgi:hypothetical protein